MAVVSTFVYMATIDDASKRAIHTSVSIFTALLAETGATRWVCCANNSYFHINSIKSIVSWIMSRFQIREYCYSCSDRNCWSPLGVVFGVLHSAQSHSLSASVRLEYARKVLVLSVVNTSQTFLLSLVSIAALQMAKYQKLVQKSYPNIAEKIPLAISNLRLHYGGYGRYLPDTRIQQGLLDLA